MPVRFLGRIIDGSITDRKYVDELAEKLSDGLKIIDKSPFKGTQKLWILQHLLIPQIQWPNLRSPNVRCHALGTESVNFYTEMASFAPIHN